MNRRQRAVLPVIIIGFIMCSIIIIYLWAILEFSYGSTLTTGIIIIIFALIFASTGYVVFARIKEIRKENIHDSEYY